jgi:hypothetical protein
VIERVTPAPPGDADAVAGDPTVNGRPLVADPAGAVTVIGPVVAFVGTVAMICVELADVIVAEAPLNETASCAAVELKPVPEIVTVVPGRAAIGLNWRTDTWDELYWEINTTLPAVS